MSWVQVECDREIHLNGSQGHLLLRDARGDFSPWAGQATCVYLDPPFMTGDDFFMRMRVGEKGWMTGKTILTLPAYQDKFSGKAEFLGLLREALENAKALLSEEGSLFLHLDSRTAAHARLLCDDIFGESNFVNEIIWAYQSGGRTMKRFSRKHDVILFYRKSRSQYFNIQAVPISRGENRSNHMRRSIDEQGRPYRSIKSGGKTYIYYDDDPVYPGDVWTDVSHLQQKDPQRTGYDTQKPLALLDRIVGCAAREGELVMDLFAGSSTTLHAAARRGCPYVGVDLSPLAPGIARRRLSEISRLELSLKPGPTDGAAEACVQRGVGLYSVQLTSFAAPCPEGREFPGFDLVDGWAVGYLEGETMRVLAQSLRTNRAPALRTQLDVPVYSGQLVLRVDDVYGRSHYFRWDGGDATELNNEAL